MESNPQKKAHSNGVNILGYYVPWWLIILVIVVILLIVAERCGWFGKMGMGGNQTVNLPSSMTGLEAPVSPVENYVAA
jgi:hypothetical protein